MTAETLPTATGEQFQLALTRAALALSAGDVVALPTETVYGLAANAWDAAAVAKIFALKGRPAHNPVIVHVADLNLARRCVRHWPESAERLAQAFWPGPLTLVLPRAADIPDAVTAGGDTVGLRWPAHPFMQALICQCGFPLAAPSANPSNDISPTRADHVARSLGDRLSLIVDGGPTPVGIESTVVDLSGEDPRVLRPGMISAEALAAVLGRPVAVGSTEPVGETLRSPGQLAKHYAPRARLVVWQWADATALRQQATAAGMDPARTVVMSHRVIPPPGDWADVIQMPATPTAYAQALYATWHRCDERDRGWIVMEAVPTDAAWHGIADRLRRAASP